MLYKPVQLIPNHIVDDSPTFLPHLDVLADSDVFAPCLLDDPSVTIVLPLSHLLQQEELQKEKPRKH